MFNRAIWSSLALARMLVQFLGTAFAKRDPIVLGLDATPEHRRGDKIKAKGIYHDAVRSSRSHFAKFSGLRWLSFMMLPLVPWAKGVWALPFLMVLAPS